MKCNGILKSLNVYRCFTDFYSANYDHIKNSDNELFISISVIKNTWKRYILEINIFFLYLFSLQLLNFVTCLNKHVALSRFCRIISIHARQLYY